MYKVINVKEPVVQIPARSNRNKVSKVALLAVDQTPSIVNHVNKFGWPMTDVQLLMQANNDMERSALASRLQLLDLNTSSAYNRLSDEDKILLLKPNWVQTPAEIERFTSQQTEYLQYKVEREKAEKLRKVSETSTTESETVENPETPVNE